MSNRLGEQVLDNVSLYGGQTYKVMKKVNMMSSVALVNESQQNSSGTSLISSLLLLTSSKQSLKYSKCQL